MFAEDRFLDAVARAHDAQAAPVEQRSRPGAEQQRQAAAAQPLAKLRRERRIAFAEHPDAEALPVFEQHIGVGPLAYRQEDFVSEIILASGVMKNRQRRRLRGTAGD